MQLYFRVPEGASIFDVCLNVYTSLNLLSKLMSDNNITSYNKVFDGKELIVYDTDFVSDEFLFLLIQKNDYIFSTSKARVKRFLLNEEGNFILQENNFKIIV